MKHFCPVCGKESELDVITRTEVFQIRGEKIPVNVEVLRCMKCHEEFEDLKSENDPYKAAYQVFRKNKGFLQPEEILEFRKKYDLTQKELGQILGFGEITLSRYENGALQDEAHDRLLRQMMKPINLLDYLREKPACINKSKLAKLEKRLSEEFPLAMVQTYLSRHQPSIENGLRLFDFKKTINMVKFLTQEKPIYRSKLLKLLFYADFYHFKKFGFSISGMRYARALYGPIPDKQELILALLTEKDPDILIQPKRSGETFKSISTFDPTSLSLDEISTLAYINQFFMKFTALEIENYSHREEGWKKTANGHIIPYSFANEINI